MRKFVKKSTYVKMVALTALTLVVGLVAPAQAQANPKCPDNAFCLYEHVDFTPGRAIFYGTDKDLSDNHYDNNHVVDNSASSMINNTGKIVVLFSDYLGKDIVYAAARNSEDSTFVNNGCNDIVSGLAFA